jgi:hypothetical protein
VPPVVFCLYGRFLWALLPKAPSLAASVCEGSLYLRLTSSVIAAKLSDAMHSNLQLSVIYTNHHASTALFFYHRLFPLSLHNYKLQFYSGDPATPLTDPQNSAPPLHHPPSPTGTAKRNASQPPLNNPQAQPTEVPAQSLAIRPHFRNRQLSLLSDREAAHRHLRPQTT